jgi:hypothetical protein
MTKISMGSLQHTCPHLGAHHDKATAYAYPSPANTCFNCKVPTTPAETHQKEFCLTPAHNECPVYAQADDQPFPPDLSWDGTTSRIPSTLWRTLLWVVLGLIVVVLASYFISIYMHTRNIGLPLIQISQSPASSPTPTAAMEDQIIPVTGISIIYTQVDPGVSTEEGTLIPASTINDVNTKNLLLTLNAGASHPTPLPSTIPSKTPTKTSSRTATKSVATDRTLVASITATKIPTILLTKTRTSIITKTPTRTLTKTSTLPPTKTRTATPSKTKTFTPTKTYTSTSSKTFTPKPTATQLPQKYRLETPFTVNGHQFLIHLISSGESYELLAHTYNTTVEILLAINYQAPTPLWVKSTIIISPGLLVDDPTIPAFQADLIVDQSTTIETRATKYNVDPTLTKLYNNCSDNCKLSSGDWIVIPHPR